MDVPSAGRWEGVRVTGIPLQCTRKKPRRCTYAWTYHGKAEWLTSCPKCKATVLIKKATEAKE